MDTSVGIVTATGWTVGVWIPAGARFFSSPERPDRLWGPPMRTEGDNYGSKAAGAWSWQLTSI
jgi:hypothetical protein